MVLLLVCITFNYKRLPKKLRLPLIMFTVVPLGATVLQAIFKGVYLSYLTVVGMAIVLYVFALDEMNNAIERAHRLEVEMLEKYQKELEKTVDERTHERIFFVNR